VSTKEIKQQYDLLKYEHYYEQFGKTLIGGCDEVGRGPLAGPVVCCAVVMPFKQELVIDGVNDSKKLTPKKREELYHKIIAVALDYQVSFVSETVIDEINILQATKVCMNDCINHLKMIPDMMLIDAVQGLAIFCPYQSIIKGDEKSYSIACASIVAKVTRDHYMEKMDEIYPLYHFFKHKGYGTKEHIAALKQYGPSPIHRKTFIKHFV